jgi:hypothetical protein
MPRNVWAKVWCDFLRHPRFRRRPDCDKVLALGLILYAKEYAANDGVVRDLDADAMRSMFGISAPLQKVQDGLEYFLQCGWLEHTDERGSLRIKDFVRRQAADSAAVRVQRWREGKSNGDANESVTKPLRKTNAKVTRGRYDVTGVALPEVEEEEEEDHDRRAVDGESEGKSSQAAASVDRQQQSIASLSESDRLRVTKLLTAGRAAEATALLAELSGAQVPDTIQRKAGSQ